MIVHRSCVAVEKDTRFLDRWHILFSDFDEAWNVMENTVHDITEVAGTDEVRFVFSDTGTKWREDFDPTYKLHRKDTRKPLAYWEMRGAIEEKFNTAMTPRLEADDVMGILMTDPAYAFETVLWSLDKDLKQIPGLHIREDEVIEITEAEGDFFHMFQTLAGDITDGYSGCPGVGDTVAERLLRNGTAFDPYQHELKSGPRKGEIEERWAERPAKDMWDTVKTTYQKYGSTEDHAIHQARLARILRHEDIKNDEVVLWEPKSSD
jgi:5'-3' exonuclease